MKKIIKVQQRPTAPLNLTWVINNICTNQCSYCPPGLHNGQNHNYDWENARRFFIDLFKRYPKIHCSVAGGEPSLSPFFREIVEIFKDNNSTIGITSNAAKPVSYWSDISKYLNYICFSWHAEFIDEKFEEKVLASANNCAVTVRIMMNTSHWERSVAEYNRWVNNPLVLVEPVRILNWNFGAQNPATYTYNEEQLEWFKNTVPPSRYLKHLDHLNIVHPDVASADFYFEDNTVESFPNIVSLINNGQTNFNGYKCDAGIKALFIDWRGKIYLANCLIDGFIGSINEPDAIKWPTGPITCNKNICHCASDVIISKWKE